MTDYVIQKTFSPKDLLRIDVASRNRVIIDNVCPEELALAGTATRESRWSAGGVRVYYCDNCDGIHPVYDLPSIYDFAYEKLCEVRVMKPLQVKSFINLDGAALREARQKHRHLNHFAGEVLPSDLGDLMQAPMTILQWLQ